MTRPSRVMKMINDSVLLHFSPSLPERSAMVMRLDLFVFLCHCLCGPFTSCTVCFDRCRKLAGRWRTRGAAATVARARRRHTERISDVRWRQWWHIATAAAATARDATNGPGPAVRHRTGRSAHDAAVQGHDAACLCKCLLDVRVDMRQQFPYNLSSDLIYCVACNLGVRSGLISRMSS